MLISQFKQNELHRALGRKLFEDYDNRGGLTWSYSMKAMGIGHQALGSQES